MTFIKTFVFAALFALCIMPAAHAQSAAEEALDNAPIGTLMEIEGTAEIARAGATETLAAAIDMPVYLNDVIETGPESRVLALLIDDTEITLGENASLSIDEYVFDPDNMNENSGRFSVMRGAFLFVSGLLTKIEEPDVEIETAYGSIGIRGTTVWGGEIDGEYGVLVNDGEVTVKTGRGWTRVGKGMGTSINRESRTPGRAKAWAPEKIEHAQGRIALKNRDQVTKRIEKFREKHPGMRGNYKNFMKKKREMQSRHHGGPPNENWQRRLDNRPELKGKPEDALREKRQEKRDEKLQEKLQEKREEMMKERLENRGEFKPERPGPQRHSPL